MPRDGNLRASDSDRELVVQRLHTAATEGRLTSDELDERVSRALSAVTYADLAATLVDLPSPRRRAESGTATRRDPRGRTRRRTVGAYAVRTVRANPMLIVFMIPLVAVTGAMLIALSTMWLVMLVVLSLVGLRSPFGAGAGRGRAAGPWRLLWDGGLGRRGSLRSDER